MEPRERTLRLLDETLGAAGVEDLAVRLWDGTRWPDETPRPATLVLPTPSALRSILVPGSELGIARAFVTGAFDVEGDLERGLEAALPAVRSVTGVRRKARLAAELAKLPRAPKPALPRAKLAGRRHSIERDRQAVSYHYDVSNEFFSLLLGPTMVYSCGYFERDEPQRVARDSTEGREAAGPAGSVRVEGPDASLEAAQTAKLDLVCRKLRLRPGQRFLDIGCGWGSLVLHAAERYHVDATGITLSERQAELAQRRIKEAGLEDRARVELVDYRELRGEFDKIASVGMVEHVGLAKLSDYFASAYRLLAPGGVFLNHGITSIGDVASPGRRTFIAKYVFPDGELVPIERMLTAAAGEGFEIRDVEDLREHYALTLRHWVRNLESRREEALQHVSEETFRVWRLYMSGSAGSFAHDRIRVYQSLLSKRDAKGDSKLPLTRADWYR